MTGGELIPRATVDEVVAFRDAAVASYERAAGHLRAAAEEMKKAQEAVRGATAGTEGRFTSVHAPEIEAFNAAQVLDPDQFARTGRRLTDIRVWASLIERTELDHLMDKEAKDALRKQMAYVPEEVDRDGVLINSEEIALGLPPVTLDSITSTLEGFAADAGSIFKRGLANAFSALDRRFRSHDGFGIGSRIILTRAFDEWGSWSYYTNHRDTLADVERVFLVLDGKGPRAAYAGIVGKVDAERRGLGRKATVHEGDYFRVRIFKNGNAHLWFTREDLVEKANKLLAEHYGEVLGEGKDFDPGYDHAAGRAVGHARNFGNFPTPDDLADRISGIVEEHVKYGGAGFRCLEPSAGTGQLARRLKDVSTLDCIELQPDLAEKLRRELGVPVRCQDFLTVAPEPRYAAVAMNPPFDKQRDVDHVRHAWDFLKPGGLLVAVMSAGVEFRQNRKAAEFRKLMEGVRARWEDLPPGTFSRSGPGTMVNTVLLTARKPVA